MSLTQPAFDPDRDFVASTFFRAAGKVYERGAPFDKDSVDQRTLKMLYGNRKIGYADASEGEEFATLAPATIEEKGGGWYHVGAPWIDEPEKIQGKDKAIFRAQEIRDAGEPLDHHGVAMVEGENSWWRVNAAWLSGPESHHGEEAAYARAAELRRLGPPQGWQESVKLAGGSDAFEESYEIGGASVSLEDLVAEAQRGSGHEPKVWNGLDQETRDGLIQAALEARRSAANEPPGGATGASGEDPGTPAPRRPARFMRVRSLVDGNQEKDLRAMAAEIDKAREAAGLEPLGVKASSTKAEIAGLIVDAGGDLQKDSSGEAA